MTSASGSSMERFFGFVLAKRWWVITFYALLMIPGAYFATRIQQDNAVDRLIVKSDPAYVLAKEFEKVFGSGEYVILLAEAKDPFAPEVLRRFDELERKLSSVPKVEGQSLVSIYRRAHAKLEITAESAAELRRFALGTDMFRKQGLVGSDFLGLALVLNVHNSVERQQVMEQIDQLTAAVEGNPAPFTALRKVGQPYVIAYLDRDMNGVGLRYFPLFGVFVVILVLSLYRSFRALLAFIISLAVCLVLTVGYIGATGGVFTIVSALVPMTVLITCTATLVYIHSRYVDQPPERSLAEHHIFALANKFMPCTVSVFATAVGFAALTVSKIRPIREMGMWVAIGLVLTWVMLFTLFPALQRVLRTPTQRERRIAGRAFHRYVTWLPHFSYRARWVLVPGSLVLCALGVVALFGFPGLVKPMRLETRQVEYINHNSQLYKDTKRIEEAMAGLSMTEIWLKGKFGDASDPKVVRGLERFEQALEREKVVGAVVGMPMMLRTLRYVAGQGDRLPADEEELEKFLSSVETLLPTEPLLQRFIDKQTLSQTHLAVVTRTADYDGYAELERMIRRLWDEAMAHDPALKTFEMQVTGFAPLQAKIAYHLVPTLVESFVLSAIIIFGAFLVVFRSGPARLMAMIPSLFAILVMFGIMRLTGMMLNVATILIASTVLGTSENDQVHFFYHFLEKGKKGTTEEGLRHTLIVAGRAIWFATLINAGGFLAFALADLPPIRQFGVLSAIAFVLSMIADFTALPAALWMVFREKPDRYKVAENEKTTALEREVGQGDGTA